MDYRLAIEHLDSLQATKIELGLDRIRKALSLLQNPERSFRSVHVAGTNGKGSTCAFLESLLRSGLGISKVGLFTSPHLVDVRERMQINRQMIDKETFAALITKVWDATCGKVALTYFEFLTVVGFLWFANEKVDVAVVEVGLGGRFDSTNVIMPLASVITRIALDHQGYLGDSIEKIAYEKAGIVKDATPVVTIDQSAEAMQVIRNVCEEKGAMLHVASPIEVVWPLSLAGRWQCENAACALAAAKVLSERYFFKDLSDDAIKASLADTKWAGRLEVVSKEPLVILDGAHNPNGAAALARYLRDERSSARKVLMIGVMADKDVDDILSVLLPYADRVVFVAPRGERSAKPEVLLAKAVALFPDRSQKFESSERSVGSLLEIIMKEEPTSTIFVTGSLYMIGEVKEGFARSDL